MRGAAGESGERAGGAWARRLTRPRICPPQRAHVPPPRAPRADREACQARPHLEGAQAILELRDPAANRVQILRRLALAEDGFAHAAAAAAAAARGRRGRLGLVAALDLHQERRLVAPELLMEKLQVLVARRDVGALAEAVGVELTDEGADVVVLEVRRQNVACEGVGVCDHEGVPLGRPDDRLVRLRVGDDLEELGEEGRHVGAPQGAIAPHAVHY